MLKFRLTGATLAKLLAFKLTTKNVMLHNKAL